MGVLSAYILKEDRLPHFDGCAPGMFGNLGVDIGKECLIPPASLFYDCLRAMSGQP